MRRYTSTDELKHFGVLGMKWGVRRTPAQLGNLSKKDNKWVKKNTNKVTEKAKKKASKSHTEAPLSTKSKGKGEKYYE